MGQLLPDGQRRTEVQSARQLCVCAASALHGPARRAAHGSGGAVVLCPVCRNGFVSTARNCEIPSSRQAGCVRTLAAVGPALKATGYGKKKLLHALLDYPRGGAGEDGRQPPDKRPG